MTADQKTPHSFTILINNQPYSTSDHELTGTQLKSLASIPQDYELFQVHGSQTVPVANDQMVHLHEKAEFRAIPAGTFGGNAFVTTSTR